VRAATDLRTSPNHSARAAGVALEAFGVHWTGGSFAATLDWIGRSEYAGKRIYASYHMLIGPRGEIAYPVAWDRAAYSLGVSRAHDARFTWTRAGNSAAENFALAGAPPRKPTPIQVELLVEALAERMRARGFGADDTWRIVGHDEVAWARGRKSDPQGQGWLPLGPVRDAVRAQLAQFAQSAAGRAA
jgi:N-acetyl-anhydromuramyl-L-alanine amidase AmpD